MSEELRLSREYVCVLCEGRRGQTSPPGTSFGGNQGWFDAEGDGYISPLGCGLISCADILLYMTGRSRIEQAEYLTFVRSLASGALKVRRKLGLNGISMALGMRKLFKELGMPYKASWCFSKRKLLPRIEEMIRNDIPVCIAAGPCIASKKTRGSYGVNFYTRDKEGSFVLPGWRSGRVKDHYVTVTAVVYTESDTMLEISSWGEKYYISWAEYTGYISLMRSFFSNILLIREKG